jgi:Lon protease-like protein
MRKFLPLFPLNLVAFPDQPLNLHVFEPRYKQLVNDCLQSKTTFGVPAYINGAMEYGSEVEILELTKTYADGRMDIKTKVLDIFKIIDFSSLVADKLYPGGNIEVLKIRKEGNPQLRIKMIDLANELFTWIESVGKVVIDENTSSYTLAYKVGLSKEQEYELLQLFDETDRQYYIINHLEKMIPQLQKAEIARERIKLNGHFKHLDPLKF